MELKDFIKSSITSIVESVEELNNELGEKGVVIAPENGKVLIPGNPDNPVYVGGFRRELIYNIDFSLSVTESKSSKAGGGVKISVISGGLSNNLGTELLNNIKFSIPIIFPRQKSKP